MAHIVTVPLVIAKHFDGAAFSDLYLYEGAPVPDSVPESEIQRLSEGGFIEDTKAIAARIEKAQKEALKRAEADQKAAEEKVAAEDAAAKAEFDARVQVAAEKIVAERAAAGTQQTTPPVKTSGK